MVELDQIFTYAICCIASNDEHIGWNLQTCFLSFLTCIHSIANLLNVFGQAKPETVQKVCQIVKKQLALSDDAAVTGESKFAALGADSLDTVPNAYP